MDQDGSTSREQGGMQFEQADFGGAGEQKFACSFCNTPFGSSYFHLNDQPACEACRYKVEAEMAIPPGVSGFFKAALAGCGAAAVGAGIYYAVLALSGYEVGIVAILVGFLVGRAVRWGSKGRGGWAYQTLAVGLTYLAIVGTYIPIIFEEIAKDEPAAIEQAATATTATASSETAQAGGAPAQGAEEAEEMGVGGVLLGLGALILLAAALPFLAGIENILGIVIIAVGLYEAWKLNKRVVLDIAGPFEIGKVAAPQPAA